MRSNKIYELLSLASLLDSLGYAKESDSLTKVATSINNKIVTSNAFEEDAPEIGSAIGKNLIAPFKKVPQINGIPDMQRVLNMPPQRNPLTVVPKGDMTKIPDAQDSLTGVFNGAKPGTGANPNSRNLNKAILPALGIAGVAAGGMAYFGNHSKNLMNQQGNTTGTPSADGTDTSTGTGTPGAAGTSPTGVSQSPAERAVPDPTIRKWMGVGYSVFQQTKHLDKARERTVAEMLRENEPAQTIEQFRQTWDNVYQHQQHYSQDK